MKRLWLNSLLLSILIHLLAFSAFIFSPFSAKIKKDRKEVKKIEIIPKESPKKTKPSKQSNPVKKEPHPYKENMMNKLLDVGKTKPSLDKVKQVQDQTGDILLSNLIKKEKLQKSSAYMNYYRIIREKIRKKAYQSYKGQDQGKIYLNFNITSNGSLEAIQLMGQSAKSSELKKIAISSIKESTPFPSFPEGLEEYSQLQFNISIHFKNN
ncbi:MAG: TonB family protein [Candidatus Omnitrophota bacterium]